MNEDFNGEIQLDVRDSVPGLEAVRAEARARRRAERPGGPVRRHRPGGVVAVRRPDQHADDGPAGRQRADLHPVAHDGPVLADALDVPHRAQPPRQPLRHDHGGDRRVPGRRGPDPRRVRHPEPPSAGQRLQHVLGGQGPQRSRGGQRPGRQPLDVAAPARASTASTASSAARPTTGIPTWSRTTASSSSRTPPRRATTSPRTWPTRRWRCCATSRRPTPPSRGTCGSALAPTTRRTTRPRSTSPSTTVPSTTVTRPTASGCWPG